MIKRSEVVAEVRRWRGTPFHHQARLRGVGVDCAGLLIGAARALGIVPPDFDVNGYGRSPDGRSLIENCDRLMTRISRSEIAPADVVVIRWARDPQHVGIVGDYLHGGFSLIHAYGTSDGKGSVIEHHLGPVHLPKIVAAYRLPGVA